MMNKLGRNKYKRFACQKHVAVGVEAFGLECDAGIFARLRQTMEVE